MSQVKDEQHQCSLGSLKLPLSQLLTSDDMTMNQRFQLSNSGPNSTLKMKIALRVLSVPQETQEGRGGERAAVVLLLGTAHGGRWQAHGWVVIAVRKALVGEAWVILHLVGAHGEIAEASMQTCNRSSFSIA